VHFFYPHSSHCHNGVENTVTACAILSHGKAERAGKRYHHLSRKKWLKSNLLQWPMENEKALRKVLEGRKLSAPLRVHIRTRGMWILCTFYPLTTSLKTNKTTYSLCLCISPPLLQWDTGLLMMCCSNFCTIYLFKLRKKSKAGGQNCDLESTA